MKTDLCPVCRTAQCKIRMIAQGVQYVCPRCGSYFMTDSAETMIGNSDISERQRTNAASWLREHPQYQVNTTNLPDLLSVAAPTIAERADKLLQFFASQIPALGVAKTIVFEDEHAQPWLGASWSQDGGELAYLTYTYLMDEKHYIYDNGSRWPYGIEKGGVTPAGYAHIEELKQRPSNSQIGF